MGDKGKYSGLLTERGKLGFDQPLPIRRREENQTAIPLNYGFPYPDSYPMAELVEAMRRVFAEDEAAALKYGGAQLASRLNQLVAQRCQERGVPTEVENIVITHGAAQGIGLVCDLLVNPGDLVLVEGPTYMGALDTFRKYCAEIAVVDVDEEGVRVDQLEDMLKSRPSDCMPKLFYTMPNFHNPTGYTMALERRHRLLDLAERYGFLILEDDAYGELRYEGEPLPSLRELDENERVLHVGSMSKILAPAVRVGWVNGPVLLARQLDRIRNDGGANPLVKAVVAAYWDSIPIEDRLLVLRQGYRQRRDALLAALAHYLPPDCTWTHPQGGYFIWLSLVKGVKTGELMDDFSRAGVNPLPGTIFYPDGRGHQQLRLSFSYPSPDELTTGVQRIVQVLGER